MDTTYFGITTFPKNDLFKFCGYRKLNFILQTYCSCVYIFFSAAITCPSLPLPAPNSLRGTHFGELVVGRLSQS